jgi:ribosomal protein S18 acetylase RimI-like enzyme
VGGPRNLASQIIDIRQFGARQFRPLLQAESQAWLEGLHWDYAPSAELISAYLNAKRLSGFALLEDGRLTGYSLYFREGPKGMIGDLFVAGHYSCANTVAPLLERTIDTLTSMPNVCRIEAQLPHLNIEQIGPYFRARSFQIYARQFMTFHFADGMGRLELATSPADPAAKTPFSSSDFQFEPWERKHDREAAQLLHHAYQNHIDAAINDQYCTLAGSRRLVESIVRQRGCGDYLDDASTVALHRSTGRPAGILGLTAVRPGTAHIPQIAVATAFQGLGLGTAMLQSSFHKLNRKGFSEVSLTVTSLNSRAVRLYERLGFRTFREFGAFVWDRPE